MSVDSKKNIAPLLIGALALILLVGLFYMFWNQGFNWHVHSYRSTDDQPYGADLSQDYLRSLRKAEDFMTADSSMAINLEPYIEDSTDYNYLVLGYLPYLDSVDLDHLFRFVENGNSVFFLTGDVPDQLMAELHQGECVFYESDEGYYYDYEMEESTEAVIMDSLVNLNFVHPDLRAEEGYSFGHHFKDKLERFPWHNVDSIYFCSENESFTAIGTINDRVNFMRVKLGEGYIYLHTNPKVFTNIYLTQESGREYADKVFGHLEEGPIIWDKKMWKSAPNKEYYSERYHQSEGALSYILSQESLKSALYLLFGGTVLFFIFGSRRKQRPIPVVRPKENSSLEYVDTISDLYYAQNGDGRIFRYISEQFQFFVRDKYRLQFKWKEPESWPLLAKASGIPEAHIRRIADKESKGSYEPNVDGVMLTDYYKLIEYFYSNCK